MKYEKVLSQTFTDNFQTALLNKNINKMKKNVVGACQGLV